LRLRIERREEKEKERKGRRKEMERRELTNELMSRLQQHSGETHHYDKKRTTKPNLGIARTLPLKSGTVLTVPF
jgi:hypothetical protein